MTECEHWSMPGMCPVSGCTNERPEDVWVRLGKGGPRRTAVAAYDGRCMGCAGPIREGDQLVHVDDRWIHQECANG